MNSSSILINHSISGRISKNNNFVIKSSLAPGITTKQYEDGYSFQASLTDDILIRTKGRVLKDDILIKKVGYEEVSNSAGGNTVYIGQGS